MVSARRICDRDGDDREPSILLDAVRPAHAKSHGMETLRHPVGLLAVHSSPDLGPAAGWMVHRSHGAPVLHNGGRRPVHGMGRACLRDLTSAALFVLRTGRNRRGIRL